MSETEWPNLFVVGAPKCGTTSFHAYLSQHSDVFTSQQKELHFFSRKCLFASANGPGDENALRDVAMEESEYLGHYVDAHQRIRADVSPSYLYYDEIAPDIRSSSPDAQVVVLIRDPVEKAYSQYLHLVRDQREELSFEEALRAEPNRIEAGWSDMWRYVESSHFSKHIQTFLDVFGEDRVLILIREELATDPVAVMQRVWQFWGSKRAAVWRGQRPETTLLSRGPRACGGCWRGQRE